MTPTDTSERGLESLIVRHLTAHGYVLGEAQHYQADVALDTVQLWKFLHATQPDVVDALQLAQAGMPRTQFLHQLQGEISKRGVVDVLRKGIKDKSCHIDLYKTLPTPGNDSAARAFRQNIFSVTRQMRYSRSSNHSVDLVIFVNGLPVLTLELKNSLTRQTVTDAILQYKTTRHPNEALFQPGRCMAHFAVDDAEVYFCTELKGQDSWFLPFNQGTGSGAGNPPNPHGLKTDYLWKQVLETSALAHLMERFAQVVEEELRDPKTGRIKKVRKPVFPRFHQWRTVRTLLHRSQQEGVGRRYLIQHSAGSGKSNTIAWLAHQLVSLRRKDDPLSPQFDSVIVITDRRALDTQITRTIKGFEHVASILGHSDDAAQLRGFLQQGKKIIITTVQKFPFVLDKLGDLSDKTFALLIDEAHSSQGGKTTAKMHQVLGAATAEEDFAEDSTQDAINAAMAARMASRRMLENASYFAFTATPKRKTLELFGEKTVVGDTVQFRSPPELTYSTRQAIAEGFILDVIAHYTPVKSFYQVAKTVADDPVFDKKRALKKIRQYVESHDTAIARKAEIMVDHFLEQVIAAGKIGGQARAMIVCNGIARAVDYFRAVSGYLQRINSPYQAIVAYSGEFESGRQNKTEADWNGFPGKEIAERFRQDPYRFLVVANKFVTGFDEPLLHSMYVDKPLQGVQAVQTLSRLNRAHRDKHDTFVLDFADNQGSVQAAFQDYYQSTIQDGETDPNRLHDLQAELENAQVYGADQVEAFVSRYLGGAERETLDPILDTCVNAYCTTLDEDRQVQFKGRAKAFVRSYGFLTAILPYGHVQWEKLSLFLQFLIPKLPAPVEEDLSRGVLDSIDMESYRIEKQATLKLALNEADATLEPIAPDIGGGTDEPETDTLSNILKAFNDLFGNIDWKDPDKVRRIITRDIPEQVAQDTTYQNALTHSDRHTARLEHDRVLARLMNQMIADQTDLYRHFTDNEDFRRFMLDTSFAMTSQRQPGTGKMRG